MEDKNPESIEFKNYYPPTEERIVRAWQEKAKFSAYGIVDVRYEGLRNLWLVASRVVAMLPEEDAYAVEFQKLADDIRPDADAALTLLHERQLP